MNLTQARFLFAEIQYSLYRPVKLEPCFIENDVMPEGQLTKVGHIVYCNPKDPYTDIFKVTGITSFSLDVIFNTIKKKLNLLTGDRMLEQYGVLDKQWEHQQDNYEKQFVKLQVKHDLQSICNCESSLVHNGLCIGCGNKFISPEHQKELKEKYNF